MLCVNEQQLTMEIRAEQPEDFAAIREVNIAAFERVNEADLVDRLRKAGMTLSFVAVEAERVVGHIFFSPLSIEGECPSPPLVLGLAPLAVLPDSQKQGIGSLLVRHSLKQVGNLGFSAIVVLGNPAYYSRFGFKSAKEKNLACEYDVPDEAFMIVELQDIGSYVKKYYESLYINIA